MEVKVIEKTNNTIMSRGNILEKKLRVAAYARVSTDSDEQSTSFYSQKNIIWIRYYQIQIGASSRYMLMKV